MHSAWWTRRKSFGLNGTASLGGSQEPMVQLANDKNVKLIHDVAEAVPFHENEDLESMADKFTDSLRVQLLGTHKAVDFTVAPHSKVANVSKAPGVQSKAKHGGSMRSAMSSLNANTLEARRSVV